MGSSVKTRQQESPWIRLAWGVVLLTAGIIFWLDRLDRLDARDYLEWWPLALIAMGLAHLPARRWGGAVAWLVVGLFFLLPRFGFPEIALRTLVNAWPLLISAAGVTLVLHAFRPRRPGLSFNAVAVMAGNTLTLGSQQLAGGGAVAVMGGIDIDLGSARSESGEISIDVLAFWGGIDIKVPHGWQVENRIVAILGGVENKTAAAPGTAPRIVLRGSAIMGGVGVTNAAEVHA